MSNPYSVTISIVELNQNFCSQTVYRGADINIEELPFHTLSFEEHF